jgi:hypothetical protein
MLGMDRSQGNDRSRTPADTLHRWLTAFLMAVAIQYIPAMALAPALHESGLSAVALTMARSFWQLSLPRLSAVWTPGA